MDELERVSDLLPLAEIISGPTGTPTHRWPPAELAPGVALRRRKHVTRDPKTQEIVAVELKLEPDIEDTRLYYWHLSERNTPGEWSRRVDLTCCPRCNGTCYVRHGGLVPGQPGFGALVLCPNYERETRRCAWPA